MPESNRYKKSDPTRSKVYLILPSPTEEDESADRRVGKPPAAAGRPLKLPMDGGNGNGDDDSNGSGNRYGGGRGKGVYLSPTTVPFYTFDEEYLERLRVSDPETTAHFHVYFSRLLHSKLRSRKLTQHVIDDIVQETFLRALRRIMAGKVREPASLGAYMNGICKNILHEHYRELDRTEPMDGDGFDVVDEAVDPDRGIFAEELRIHVEKVLARMDERQRSIITDIINDRDKDEICREHGVDRAYLRVLLHRALRLFKKLYKKH